MLLPFQGAGIGDVWFPGCRFALPRAMCSLPRRGASIQGTANWLWHAHILCPED